MLYCCERILETSQLLRAIAVSVRRESESVSSSVEGVYVKRLESILASQEKRQTALETENAALRARLAQAETGLIERLAQKLRRGRDGE